MKKTITINEGDDELIRKVWAELVRRGERASYSKALEVLLFVGRLSIITLNKIPDDIDKIAQVVVETWQSMDGDNDGDNKT